MLLTKSIVALASIYMHICIGVNCTKTSSQLQKANKQVFKLIWNYTVFKTIDLYAMDEIIQYSDLYAMVQNL